MYFIRYDSFRGEYDVGLESKVSLDILDTGGSCEFPAMKRLAIG